MKLKYRLNKLKDKIGIEQYNRDIENIAFGIFIGIIITLFSTAFIDELILIIRTFF